MNDSRSTLSRAEAARRVGCSTWSIDCLIDERCLRVVRIGVGRVCHHIRVEVRNPIIAGTFWIGLPAVCDCIRRVTYTGPSICKSREVISSALH